MSFEIKCPVEFTCDKCGAKETIVTRLKLDEDHQSDSYGRSWTEYILIPSSEPLDWTVGYYRSYGSSHQCPACSERSRR